MVPKDFATIYAIILFIGFWGGAWLYSRYLKSNKGDLEMNENTVIHCKEKDHTCETCDFKTSPKGCKYMYQCSHSDSCGYMDGKAPCFWRAKDE